MRGRSDMQQPQYSESRCSGFVLRQSKDPELTLPAGGERETNKKRSERQSLRVRSVTSVSGRRYSEAAPLAQSLRTVTGGRPVHLLKNTFIFIETQ